LFLLNTIQVVGSILYPT